MGREFFVPAGTLIAVKLLSNDRNLTVMTLPVSSLGIQPPTKTSDT
jgi:hypothetical protein